MGVITMAGGGRRRGRRNHNPRFYDEGPRVREERIGWPRRRHGCRVLGSRWAGGGVHEQGGGERLAEQPRAKAWSALDFIRSEG